MKLKRYITYSNEHIAAIEGASGTLVGGAATAVIAGKDVSNCEDGES